MTTSTSTLSAGSPSPLLRRALLLDAAVTGGSGLLAVVAAGLLAPLMGLASPLILVVLGVVFVGYAWRIYRFATARPIPRSGAIAAVILNTLWVLGSASLLVTGWVPLTLAGRWIVVVVADIVGLFAILQFLGLRQADRGRTG
jgi:hypothetical protein